MGSLPPLFGKKGEIMLKFFAMTALVLGLQGCMVAALAPLVGGMAPSDNKYEVDPATITPELKAAFTRAKSLTVLSTDVSVTHMAEYLDDKNAYVVKMVEPPKGSTPSQRREFMTTVCRSANRGDLILSPSASSSDAGSGASNMGAMLLGRVMMNLTNTVEVLRCSDNWRAKFGGKLSLSQGTMNMDQLKTDQVIGIEVAKAIMQLGGK
jgi:hypothetical protein